MNEDLRGQEWGQGAERQFGNEREMSPALSTLSVGVLAVLTRGWRGWSQKDKGTAVVALKKVKEWLTHSMGSWVDDLFLIEAQTQHQE